ncbi:hypothetical protein ABC345_09800 [Shouchella sp. 1P09AA]|uniref:hypothetical protein n=1 Tax=unclassified Shouchella TaxID=2893065 RepID=UPI0039A29DF8
MERHVVGCFIEMKQMTRRSISLLVLVLLLIFNLVFLDAVSRSSFVYDSVLWTVYVWFIPLSIILIVILIIVSFFTKNENRSIATFAIVVLGVIVLLFFFFAYFGANFA